MRGNTLRLLLLLGSAAWYLGYKADSINPTLLLQFDKQRYAANGVSKSFSDVLTFSRASTATYFDASGVLQTAASDEARFDHNPATGEALGLLVEGQRTNSLLYSNNPQNVWWTTTGASLTPLTSTFLGYFSNPVSVRSNGATWHRIQSASSLSVTSGAVYAWTAFIRAGTSGRVRLQLRNETGPTEAVLNGVVGGTLSVGSSTFGAITHGTPIAVDGGYIYSGTFTPNATTSAARFGVGPDSSVAGETVIFYGAQVEAGEFPSSYIPTSGSAVTRLADAVVNNSATPVPFASWYNQTEGTVVVKFQGIGGDATSPKVYAIGGETIADRHTINLAATTRNISLGVFKDGASQASRGSSISGLSNSAAALAYKTNDFAFSVNGDAPTTDTSGTPPTCDSMALGKEDAGANYLFGWIKALYYYPIRISNAELQRITL